MNLIKLALLRRLLTSDRNRASLPGEHLAALGAGAFMMTRGGRGSTLGRLASLAIGGALIARGLGGRDGALAKLKTR